MRYEPLRPVAATLFALAGIALALVCVPTADAQRPKNPTQTRASIAPPFHGEQCCIISEVTDTTVLAMGGMGSTIVMFKRPNPSAFGTVQRGQKVWVDFGRKKVGLAATRPCCDILMLFQTPTLPSGPPDL